MVVKRGTNEHEILPMARHFRGTGIVLRFIEYMDVGATNGWRMDEVMPSAEVVEAGQPRNCRWSQLEPSAPGETAERWGYADGSGEIGVISSVTQAFCGDCNRARLSTEGKLYLCLFATQGHDLRSLIRGGASDDQTRLRHRPDLAWPRRSLFAAAQQHAAGHRATRQRARVEMSYIGRLAVPIGLNDTDDESQASSSPAAAARAWAASTRACRISTACPWPCIR